MRTTLLSLCLLCASAGLTQSLTDSLIAHFPLDGSGMDTIGGLVPITVEGSPLDTTDRFGNSGQAMWFDGSSFFSYGDVLDMDTSDFSVSLWVNVDGYTSGTIDHDYPLSKGTTIHGTPQYSGYSIGVRDTLDPTLTARGYAGDQASSIHDASGPVQFGTWQHIFMNRCDTMLTIWLDGIPVDHDTLAPMADLTTNIYFSIGAEDRSPTVFPDVGFFKGAIDDIRIYKGRCLSNTEIVALACTDMMVNLDTTSCDPILIGDTLFTSSAMLMETFTSLGGCDSTVIHNITITPLDTTVILDAGVITAVQDSADYQWIDCGTGQPVPGETGQSFMPMDDGHYAVQVDNGVCQGTSECATFLGLNEATTGAGLRVWPVPSGGRVNIQLPLNSSSSRYQIVNATGQVVRQLQLRAGTQEVALDLPAGAYVLRNTTDARTPSRILIIQ
ncbi:MAG: T9SS type A sorting domain-containing protein [Flavobacteriales bacterium]|nr:T9SS type A sorting domain-containing protein [Flavobacteriales bacterium]MCB0783600.1 T9SS type A sorting domain-containing protein [Flavobacteriales bacterium]MCB0815792.1 T9SS type A sorting domain-containing protein [Flavobacteriales bacterium]